MDNIPQLLNADWLIAYKEIKRSSIDLILTDPPFGILEKEGWDRGVALDELEVTFERVLKETGLVIMFCNLELLNRSLEQFSRFTLRSYHIWHKSSAMPISELMPLPDAEFIIVLKRKGVRTSDSVWCPRDMLSAGKPYEKRSNILESPTRRHIKKEISKNSDGKRWVSTIIEAPNKPCMHKKERSSHPSQKPEQLLRLLIRGYSNRGDLVLDPFAGSGSTLISSYREGRSSIGYELNETFFNEAQDRINRATSQQTLYLEQNKPDIIQETLDTEVSV
ncbi:MAG: site-specific DNA-methyltransferase [Candidatus Marinimicrobia bacterium]|nr:site-specific DNA-methyltransferase [Candidatus Neomarinimicrobiota bacterium]